MKGAILYLVLIVAAIYFLIQHGVDESSREAKSQSLTACQTEVTFSKKLHDKALVKEAQELLRSENYILTSSISKAEFMKSKISNYLDKDGVDKVVRRVIKNISKADLADQDSKKLTIKYLIVENDKHNLIKRDGKVDFFVGYLDFKFFLDNKIVYESQIDFIGPTGEDIPRRIECAINSFISL